MVPKKQYRLWYISFEDIFYPVSDTSREPDSCKQDKVVQATSISIGYIYNLAFLILPKQQAQGGLPNWAIQIVYWYTKFHATDGWLPLPN